MITGSPRDSWAYWHIRGSAVTLGRLQVQSKTQVWVGPFSQVPEWWNQICPEEEKGSDDMKRLFACYGINRERFYPKMPQSHFLESSLATKAKLSSSKDLRALLAKTKHNRAPGKLLKRISNQQARKRSLDLSHHNRVKAAWLLFLHEIILQNFVLKSFIKSRKWRHF